MLYYRDRKIIKPNSVPITKELVMLVKTRPFKKKNSRCYNDNNNNY